MLIEILTEGGRLLIIDRFFEHGRKFLGSSYTVMRGAMMRHTPIALTLLRRRESP
jgi:hypothetical protein